MTQISTEDTPDLPPGLTTAQNLMLGRISQGATPDNAALAAGIKDWRTDPKFAAVVNQLHACRICDVEQHAHTLALAGRPIPTGLNFILQAFCGWRTKYAEDGFAQEVHITIQAVDGYTREGEAPAETRPPVRKYRGGQSVDA